MSTGWKVTAVAALIIAILAGIGVVWISQSKSTLTDRQIDYLRTDKTFVKNVGEIAREATKSATTDLLDSLGAKRGPAPIASAFDKDMDYVFEELDEHEKILNSIFSGIPKRSSEDTLLPSQERPSAATNTKQSMPASGDTTKPQGSP